MFKVFAFLFLANACLGQDFGEIFTVYNQSTVVVNFINGDQAKAYQQSDDVTNLEEQKWYIGGRRIQGDYLVSETYDKFDYGSEARDFYLELKYPPQNEFYVTHISCLVEQSSSIGRAYVIEGGVGYNYMKLVFEAKRTRYFYYRVYLFGRKYS